MNLNDIVCNAKSVNTRNGFAHVATALLPGGLIVKHRVSYINRAWESYPYQTALHGLLEKVAVAKFGAPSVKSLKAKKWAMAAYYAKWLMAECDREHGLQK